MNALFTVNINHALRANSAASMTDAAARWGCAFIEHTTPVHGIHPAAVKTMPFILHPGLNRVMVLDADTIVSSACPSPFAAFKETDFVAVQNGSSRFGDLDSIKRCEIFEWAKVRARYHGAEYGARPYFNSGMMLASRAHHAWAFAKAHEMAQVDLGLGWIEQTPINFVFASSSWPVLLADETWNYIHPEHLPNWLRMQKYVYHFAGSPDRNSSLDRVQWRVS